MFRKKKKVDKLQDKNEGVQEEFMEVQNQLTQDKNEGEQQKNMQEKNEGDQQEFMEVQNQLIQDKNEGEQQKNMQDKNEGEQQEFMEVQNQLTQDKSEGEQQENMEVQNNQMMNNANTKNFYKRKRKEVAIYGNYRNYYGYRIGEDMEEDSRLKFMRKKWFEGKECLDIGCNSGFITTSIATKFNCKKILGIDIDGDRVEDAERLLRKLVHKSARKIHPDEGETPDACKIQRRRKPLSNVVSFKEANFVGSWKPPAFTSYDVILCLSVTKWIHLNWGDDGIIKLFYKAWKLLKWGGVFIVEPQPWSSYSKKCKVSMTASMNYHEIGILPKDFQEVLLDKIGFRTVECLTSSVPGCKTGFDRPILAAFK